MPRPIEELAGQVFANRRVIERAPDREWGGQKVVYWEVECLACGNRTQVQASSLKRGAGCMRCKNKGKSKGVKKALRPSAPPPSARNVVDALTKLPDGDLVHIHMVGEMGHAIRPVRGLAAAAGKLLLVVELPTEIEPWAR